MAIVGLGVLSMSLLSPVLPLYLDSINISPEIIGLMFSVAMVGTVIGEPSSGWLADRLGIKLPLIVGSFASALAVFCFVLTRYLPAIFFIFLFWGVVRSALFGPSRGYIGVNTPLPKRATYMAILTVVISAARSLGALPSGFMVDSWGYNSVFFVATGIAVLGGGTVVVGLRRMRSLRTAPPGDSPAKTDGFSSVNGAISLISLVPQFVVTLLLFIGLGTLMTFGPLLATQVIEVGATEVGILFAIAGLTSAAMGIPLGMLADRMGKKTFMTLGLLVSAVAMAGIAFSESFSWIIVFVVVYGLGLVMFTPAALGFLSESVPESQQSTAMGVYGGMGENMGLIVGSASGGFVWSALGPQAPFLMSSLAAAIGVVVCLVFVRNRSSSTTGLADRIGRSSRD